MKFKTFFSTLFLAISVAFCITSCETSEVDLSVPGEVQLYGNCLNSAASNTLGSSSNYTYSVASLLSGDGLAAEGTKILGVRMYIGGSVTGGSIFVGSSYSNPEYSQSFTYKAGGWQYVLFDESIEITGEDLYIGYSCTGTGYILGYESSSRSTSSEYFNYGSGWTGTYSALGEYIYWSLQAIVTGGDYSGEIQNDIVVESVTADSYSLAGDVVTIGCDVRNNGIKVAGGITLTCEFGGQTATETVSDSLMNGQSAYVAFNVYSPSLAGQQNITVTASSSAGDEDSSNDASTTSHFIYLEDLERNAIIVEQFTTANCGYCPAGTTYMSDYIAALSDPSKVVWVAHHAGYGTDDLTLTESSTVCTALGVSGAPSCATNRVDVGYGLSYHPYYASTDILTSLINMPAGATIDLTTDYDDTTSELTVNVSGRTTSTTSTNYITVLVKQSGIVMSQTDYNETGYVNSTYSHNNAPRAFLSAAIGDELTIDSEGNYSEQYTYTIPSAIGGYDCVAEDMDVVVYIHGYIYSESTCLVYNADQVSVVGDTEPASIKRLYMNNYTPTIKSDSPFLFSEDLYRTCVK